MSTPDPKSFSKYTQNPLIASLPAHLKDPKNFKKIQKAIINTTRVCRKSHADVLEMANCLTCTHAMLERRALLKRLGFRNAKQYMAWRKIHEEIRKMMPLVDFKKE